MVVRNLLADQLIYLIAGQRLSVLDVANYMPEGVPTLSILLSGERSL